MYIKNVNFIVSKKIGDKQDFYLQIMFTYSFIYKYMYIESVILFKNLFLTCTVINLYGDKCV